MSERKRESILKSIVMFIPRLVLSLITLCYWLISSPFRSAWEMFRINADLPDKLYGGTVSLENVSRKPRHIVYKFASHSGESQSLFSITLFKYDNGQWYVLKESSDSRLFRNVIPGSGAQMIPTAIVSLLLIWLWLPLAKLTRLVYDYYDKKINGRSRHARVFMKYIYSALNDFDYQEIAIGLHRTFMATDEESIEVRKAYRSFLEKEVLGQPSSDQPRGKTTITYMG